jgi:hypothetical protein
MDLRPIPPEEAEKVDGVIIQTIGGTTNVAFGRGTVEASGQGQQVTAIGDRAAIPRQNSGRGVRSFLRSDWEASTTATVELPSPDQHSAHPFYMYICVPHEHTVSCPLKSACSVEAMITFWPALPRNASFFLAAEVGEAQS